MTAARPLVEIRQASSQDISRITNYLDSARLVHRNLDWRPLIEWVEQEPFLLRLEDRRISAMLSCAPDPPGISWVHCFAMDLVEGKNLSIWKSLLHPAQQRIKEKNALLYTISLHDWYSDLLIQTGFKRLQNILVLAWSGSLPPVLPLNQSVLVRPMESSDLDRVALLDREAFSPHWVISRESLQRVYIQAEHHSVAEINDHIVGYEISTADIFSCHLTRLAVSPAYTRANIAYTLVRGMLSYFSDRGIHHATVNTQDDNAASLALYKKLGYIPTRESFPIFMNEI